MSLELAAAAPALPVASVPDVAAAVAAGAPPDDLRGLRAVHVNPVRRVAWVQPGATWAELDAATQAHGLAVTGGRVPTALVGETVAGAGSGWLERWMGLAPDNLRAARVVTAGGQVVHASADQHADLLWAVRGGDGRCGVPVELELALRPLGPEVLLGGVLVWPRERAAEVARRYRDVMAQAPDALCGGLVLTTVRGRPSVAVVVLYAGTAPGRGAAHVAALRALEPAVDTVAPRPYRQVQGILDGRPEEGPRGPVARLTDPALDAILAGAPTSPTSALLLLPLGGAHGRVPELRTARGDRSAPWAVEVLTDLPEERLRAHALVRALAPASRPGTAERAARLAEVEAAWDPNRLFAGAAVRELRPPL